LGNSVTYPDYAGCASEASGDWLSGSLGHITPNTIMHFWTNPFSAHDRDYEIRVVFDGLTFRLRAFLDGRPANGCEYSVTLETATNMETYTGVDTVNELVRVAMEHVRQNI
jgi:hypothetical protein